MAKQTESIYHSISMPTRLYKHIVDNIMGPFGLNLLLLKLKIL